MNTPTLSLRVPLEQQQLVRDVVIRLKADAGFAEALQAMLPQPVEAMAAPSELVELRRRVADIERWIDAHGSIATQPTPPTREALAENRAADMPTPVDVEPAPIAEEPTSDQLERRRRGQAVPPEVIAEVDRRIRNATDSGAKIAADLGVTNSYVSKRRKLLTA